MNKSLQGRCVALSTSSLPVSISRPPRKHAPTRALNPSLQRREIIPLVVGILLALGSDPVFAQRISELVVFGDSNSDTGNTAIEFNVPDSPPYYAGRFSNGPMWIEYLAHHLNVTNPRPSLLGGSNYAYGGATSGASAGFDTSTLLNMDAQVDAYLNDHTPSNDQLFVMDGGYNDFFFEPVPVDDIAAALSSQITDLANAGARQFLVANVIAGVPEFDREALIGSADLNTLMDAEVERLQRELPITIHKYDARALVDQMMSDPQSFGFSHVQTPACVGCSDDAPRENPVQIAERPDDYIIWDDTHFSASAHRIIGDAAFESLPTSLKPKTESLIDDAQWRFFRGVTEPLGDELAWTQTEFDDTSWDQGAAGFGFGDSNDLYFAETILDDMWRSYSTVYVRHEFAAGDVAGMSSLLLAVDYDDAFIAYINGEEVARSDFGEVGEPVPYDGGLRIAGRDSSFREVFQIDLAAFPQLLLEGPNVLAIQGINRSAGDRDFVLSQISLSAVMVPEPRGITLGVLSTLACLMLRQKRFSYSQSAVIRSRTRGSFSNPGNGHLAPAVPGPTNLNPNVSTALPLKSGQPLLARIAKTRRTQ